MKKTIAIFCSILLLAICAQPVFAAEKADIKTDFFKGGDLEKPNTPYVVVCDNDNNEQHASLSLYLEMPSDQIALAEAYQKLSAENPEVDPFEEKYKATAFTRGYQIDAKFDGGAWLSTKGDWDAYEPNYGDNMESYNLTFLLEQTINSDDSSTLQNTTQSWLTYMDESNPVNDFLKPYIKNVGTKDEPVWNFNLKDHTIAFRIRFFTKYEENAYSEEAKQTILLSPWSDETSIGKDGKQEELTMPEKIDPPILSDFSIVTIDNNLDGQCYFTIPASLYQAEKYRLIMEAFEPYSIEVQFKVNDGDWVEGGLANAAWMTNGYRSIGAGDILSSDKNDIQVRARIHDNTTDENTEWSNIVGTKAVEKQLDTVSESEDNGNLTSEKTKCKLCGICPVQPLGICLFVWIGIALVIIILLIVIIKKATSKNKQ